MATISEDYCDFETAKLLKDKGYDQNCATYYLDGQVWRHYHGEVIPKGKQIYAAPSQAMAMKWLREVRNRFIEVQTDKGHDFKSIVFRPAIYDEDLNCLWESDNYKSYEQAAEAAIKHCLEHLNNYGNN